MLRRPGILVATMLLIVTFAPPALAQSGSGSASASSSASAAAQDQYESYSASAIADGIEDVADTSAQGTGAVNDALSGTDPATGLDALPETGGPSPAALLAGVFLVGIGLTVRRGIRG